MHKPDPSRLRHICNTIKAALLGPPMLAFLPALTLAMFWMGGEPALLVGALGVANPIRRLGGFGGGDRGLAGST